MIESGRQLPDNFCRDLQIDVGPDQAFRPRESEVRLGGKIRFVFHGGQHQIRHTVVPGLCFPATPSLFGMAQVVDTVGFVYQLNITSANGFEVGQSYSYSCFEHCPIMGGFFSVISAQQSCRTAFTTQARMTSAAVTMQPGLNTACILAVTQPCGTGARVDENGRHCFQIETAEGPSLALRYSCSQRGQLQAHVCSACEADDCMTDQAGAMALGLQDIVGLNAGLQCFGSPPFPGLASGSTGLECIC